MARRRLGVVLFVPPPYAGEVDGLRRACGDGMLDRVGPHLTLVPPVNVRADALGTALAVVRAAAGSSGPLALSLGPVATFHPAAPVVYLAVSGPGLDALDRLRSAVFQAPLARPITHEFVPHVTVGDDLDESRIPAAVAALADYRADVVFEWVHVLEEHRDRVWRPIADVRLGPPVIVGRGGLPLELTPGTVVDPEASALVGDPAPAEPEAVPLVVTARREGRVVGVLQGWTARASGQVTSIVVAADAASDEVDRHLVAAARSAAADRGCDLPKIFRKHGLEMIRLGSDGANHARHRGRPSHLVVPVPCRIAPTTQEPPRKARRLRAVGGPLHLHGERPRRSRAGCGLAAATPAAVLGRHQPARPSAASALSRGTARSVRWRAPRRAQHATPRTRCELCTEIGCKSYLDRPCESCPGPRRSRAGCGLAAATPAAVLGRHQPARPSAASALSGATARSVRWRAPRRAQHATPRTTCELCTEIGCKSYLDRPCESPPRPAGHHGRVDNMKRLEAIVARLPEAERVDIEAWGGEPTFRVRGKNFVFSAMDASGISVKLSKEEAEAVVATDPGAEPTGYGLGRHGWVSITIGARASRDRWQQVEEWVRTSYTMVAPKKLAKIVLDEDAAATTP